MAEGPTGESTAEVRQRTPSASQFSAAGALVGHLDREAPGLAALCDPEVKLLAAGWLAGFRSPRTRRAYAGDLAGSIVGARRGDLASFGPAGSRLTSTSPTCCNGPRLTMGSEHPVPSPKDQVRQLMAGQGGGLRLRAARRAQSSNALGRVGSRETSWAVATVRAMTASTSAHNAPSPRSLAAGASPAAVRAALFAEDRAQFDAAYTCWWPGNAGASRTVPLRNDQQPVGPPLSGARRILGGSAAAQAAGFRALSIGSDLNGSLT